MENMQGGVLAAPGGVPLLGHALSLRRQPLEFFKAMRQYGDVVGIRLGRMPVYIINDPELMRQILIIDSKQFDKGSIFDKATKFIGNGLATSSGDFHRRQRRHVQPAFHHGRMPAYAQIMAEVAQRKAESWAAGQQLELLEQLHEITLVTVARTLFSTSLGEAVVSEFRRSLPLFLSEITRRSFSPFPILEKLPTATNRRFDATAKRMRSAIFDAIGAYRADGRDNGDLLSVLIAADPVTGACMSDEQVHDEIITLMITGTETSASTLSWTFHELAAHPEIERKMYDEVATVLAGRRVCYDDLPKLEYLRRILTETLRLHQFPMIPRRALTEVAIGGRVYPAKTQFFISPYALHQDPKYFAEPDRFDPDRWLPERAESVHKDTFLPFGAGVRKCIGDSYAWNDMTIILATISAMWRLVPEQGHQVKEVMLGVVRPDRLPMITEPRSSRLVRRSDTAEDA